MNAELITRFRNVSKHGAIIEMVVWRLLTPIPPSVHVYKYRLVYVIDGRRVIGFDNERGKGDHIHKDDQQIPYKFIDVDKLIDDFIQEVEAWQNAH